MQLFTTSTISLYRNELGGGRYARWSPLLMLGWSAWVFVTPLGDSTFFPHWLWPTLASYALFLWLYWRAFFGDRAHLRWHALGIAVLGFAVTPVNPGAQGYIIFACAFLGYCGSSRQVSIAVAALLLTYAGAWQLSGWPNIYLLTTVMVGAMVALLNLLMQRKAQADAALRLSHDQVRRLAASAERERIGRDLHDLLGHTLSLVALKADLAGRLIARDPAAARSEIDELARVARQALAQVRRAVTGIRSAELVAELAAARLLLETDGIALECRLPAEPPQPLPQAMETTLALCLREAVTNIQRHAHAARVTVALHYHNDGVQLQIDDDGRGGEIIAGQGLCGMRERLRALGGRLELHAPTGRGTRVQAWLPWPATPPAPASAMPWPATIAPLPRADR